MKRLIEALLLLGAIYAWLKYRKFSRDMRHILDASLRTEEEEKWLHDWENRNILKQSRRCGATIGGEV